MVDGICAKSTVGNQSHGEKKRIVLTFICISLIIGTVMYMDMLLAWTQ